MIVAVCRKTGSQIELKNDRGITPLRIGCTAFGRIVSDPDRKEIIRKSFNKGVGRFKEGCVDQMFARKRRLWREYIYKKKI